MHVKNKKLPYLFRSAIYLLIGFLSSLSFISYSFASEWSGYIGGEYRLFAESPADPRQHGNNFSLSTQPEFFTDWDNGKQSFTFVPFARWDENDKERSHADIRELTWLKAEDTWELRVGIRKLFWGVTESTHLVDIINQTDLVEASDGEEKLGQPMINLALIKDWGTVDVFILPGFRERTFPGENGRLRSPLPVDTDNAIYESSQEVHHIDYAARWSHALGDWDIGLSYFNGTSRDPLFIPNASTPSLSTALLPVYNLIEQWGIDLQATLNNWLWKVEAINRSGQGKTYYAMSGGFEYTFYGINETQYDLGVISEIMHDDRGDNATTPFADDILLGARLTLNDEQSTEFLMGIIFDSDDSTRLISLESSRRFGDSWKATLEGQAFIDIPDNDLLSGVKEDSYLQLEVVRYF